MKEKEKLQEERQCERAEKKPYNPPELKRIGNVMEITYRSRARPFPDDGTISI